MAPVADSAGKCRLARQAGPGHGGFENLADQGKKRALPTGDVTFRRHPSPTHEASNPFIFYGSSRFQPPLTASSP
jgi:hypothetical protein